MDKPRHNAKLVTNYNIFGNYFSERLWTLVTDNFPQGLPEYYYYEDILQVTSESDASLTPGSFKTNNSGALYIA